MNILGLSYFQNCHDTSAAIVCDGELVAAAEEERFTRRKHESAFPLRAIDFCLGRAGMKMSEIDALAYADLPFRTGRDSHHGELNLSFFKEMHAEGRLSSRSLFHKRALDPLIDAGIRFRWQMNTKVSKGLAALRRTYGRLPAIRFYDHHRAHAAAAFFTSGLPGAAVATLDGIGGLCSSVTWRSGGGRIHRVRAEPFYNSLGTFYSDCTRYLGLGAFGEGKTMGLASYGERCASESAISSIMKTAGSRWYKYCQPPHASIVGFARRDDEYIVRPPYSDFAAGVQQALQRAVARVGSSAIKEAQCRDLCLGGGVALNCTSNGALLRSVEASSVWVFPASGDAGLSVGAALLCANEGGESTNRRINNVYWGPDFGSTEYEAALKASGLVYRRSNNIAGCIAEHLAAGDIVGWFQGRMEFGPRALGNRSILADPRQVETRDRVNRIKSREAWRPLSPVILAENAADFFDVSTPSPFMLFATSVRHEMRHLIPAVVHVDGSARPQTITRDQNPPLHDLLVEFKRRTGVPVLLNTSFNSGAEPIVCTPEDASRTFLATGLDVLVLGDYLALKDTRAARPSR